MTRTKNKSEKRLYSFYKQMFNIRIAEEKLLELFTKGLLNGTVHTCIGQEGSAVGVINALDREKDIIFSTHRAHGHYLAYSDDVKGLLAEIMGKNIGICRGIGGSQHLSADNFFSSGVQGNLIAVAIGSALAEKIKKSKSLVAVFLGDGTLGQGVVYEAFNIASLWSLPIIFIIENNKYAQTTPLEKHLSGDIYSRADTFGISSTKIADDVGIIFEITTRIVNKIRKKNSPHVLYIDTYRLAPHSKGDDFRPKEELNIQRNKDPLVRLRSRLNLNIVEKIESNCRVSLDRLIQNLLEGNIIDKK